jgi:hypothetical protein
VHCLGRQTLQVRAIVSNHLCRSPGFLACHGRLICIPSLSRRKARLGVYLPMRALHPSVTRPYYRPHRRPIFFTSGFPPSSSGCSLLCTSPAHKAYKRYQSVVEDSFSQRGISGLSLAPIAMSDTPVGSGKNWLAIQEHGSQMSHGVSSIDESAPMRKLPQRCLWYKRHEGVSPDTGAKVDLR